MSDVESARPALRGAPRLSVSKGLLTVGGATVLLFIVSAAFTWILVRQLRKSQHQEEGA